jgi:hypothetical protein
VRQYDNLRYKLIAEKSASEDVLSKSGDLMCYSSVRIGSVEFSETCITPVL